MKRKTLGRLIVLTLALTLVTASLLSGTLAKYTSTVTGTGSAQVAAWAFTVEGLTGDPATFTVDLDDTLTYSAATLDEDRIAPGTSGSFDIKVDATGSEVGVDYTIAFGEVSNKPTNLNFYSDEDFNNAYDMTTGFTGNIAADANDLTKTETVYWNWPYQTTNGDDEDTADAGKAVTFTITITGTQVTPTAVTP